MKRILVLRLDALGDTVLSLPFLKALKDKMPDSYVSVVASERGAPTLRACSYVDDIKILDMKSITSKKELLEQIQNEKFDLSFSLSEKIEAYELPFKAGIPERIGFRPGLVQPIKEFLSRILCTSSVFYPNTPEKAQGMHEVERQFKLLQLAGIEATPEKVPLPYRDETENLPPFFKNVSNIPLLHFSPKWYLQGWEENFLVRVISEILGVIAPQKLLLTYAPSDSDAVESLKGRLNGGRVLLFSDPSFDKWVSLMSKASMVITPDTSASHIAAALSLPTVVIFEERYYEHVKDRWHPWMTDYYPVKRPAQPCRNPFSASEKEFEQICDKEDLLLKEILNGVAAMLPYELRNN